MSKELCLLLEIIWSGSSTQLGVLLVFGTEHLVEQVPRAYTPNRVLVPYHTCVYICSIVAPSTQL